MTTAEVLDALVEKAAAAAHAKIVADWAVQPPWDEITEGLRDRSRAVMRHALAAVLPEYGATVLEELAADVDREAAQDRVKSRVADVRCPRCDLRYEERDQYGCGQSGYGHEYDDAELVEAAVLHIAPTYEGDHLRVRAARLRAAPTEGAVR